MDPSLAFAQAEARRRDEKAKRDPAIWLPGADDLDEEPTANLYGVRPTLARMMVIRGVKAILDAELRRDGEFLRDRNRY